MRDQPLVQKADPSFQMPTFHTRVPEFEALIHSLLSFPVDIQHGSQQVRAQDLGFLPPVWETRMGFEASGFDQIQP